MGRKAELLPFKIVRFDFDDLNIEISLGRIEKFIPGNLSHKNFDVEFVIDDQFKKKDSS